MEIRQLWLLLIFSLWIASGQSQEEAAEPKAYHDFSLEVEGEYSYYFESGQFPGQKDHFPSIAVRPEYLVEWREGDESLNFLGFARLDRDEFRTKWDIRELYYQRVLGNWELNLGIKKIFWGVTESTHLVDIINQTDVVESFDGEEKLGQPMAQAVYRSPKLGTFSIFYLPYHRRLTLPGEKGRLRFPVIIERDDPFYESGAEEWRQDFSLRWNHYFGIADIGLSYFNGNGREPLFIFGPDGPTDVFYPVIQQAGLDLQLTHGAFLWKLEAIYRHAEAQDFSALAAGLEYTFGNIDGNGLDIGVLGDYLYDSRDEIALSAQENDVFFGSRIAFNDTQDTSILIGGIADLKKSSKVFSIEASRRFGNSWRAELETRIFTAIDPREFILSNFSQDSFLKLTISKFF